MVLEIEGSKVRNKDDVVIGWKNWKVTAKEMANMLQNSLNWKCLYHLVYGIIADDYTICKC